MTLHLLGLRGVMDSPIGNTTIRGVSGGERHRVTTAEMVSGTKFTCCNLKNRKNLKERIHIAQNGT
jgi:hypothetical protein